MNRILRHILTAILFLSGLMILLIVYSFAFAPKENEKNIGLLPPVLYGVVHEPKDSIDILILGNSETHISMIPMQIWDEHGYTTFDCGSTGQPVSQSNTILNFAMDYQSPKIVIVETDMLYTHNSVYRAFIDQTEYFFPVLITHNRWKSKYDERIDTLTDYTEITETKNYRYTIQAEPADASGYMSPSDVCEPIPFVNRYYLERIKACCDAKGAKLVLVSAPSVVNWTTAKHNGVEQFAKENQIDFIDMNTLQKEIPIDWNTETIDKGDHINYYGAKKATAYLGRYLAETNLLNSHKNDPAYAKWHTLSNQFKEKINP